jgi:hypothetical protein
MPGWLGPAHAAHERTGPPAPRGREIGKQLAEVHQLQQGLAGVGELCQADDEVGSWLAAHARAGMNLPAIQGDDLRDGVDDQADRTAGHVDDDRHGVVARLGGHAQRVPQVDHGHDDAAQVHDAQQPEGCVGDAGGRFVVANFLHGEDVDAVLPGSDVKRQDLAWGGAGDGLLLDHGDGCHGALLAFRRRAAAGCPGAV